LDAKTATSPPPDVLNFVLFPFLTTRSPRTWHCYHRRLLIAAGTARVANHVLAGRPNHQFTTTPTLFPWLTTDADRRRRHQPSHPLPRVSGRAEAWTRFRQAVGAHLHGCSNSNLMHDSLDKPVS